METLQNLIPNIVVQSNYGEVKGFLYPELHAIGWLGVPYAEPPVGELRWKAPREPQQWSGRLEAVEYKQPFIQSLNGEVTGSEDCLYLNIWRPSHQERMLPVFVFIHGGGNVSGSGKDFVGDRLAVALNSIVITVNYRLGLFGFFRHPALQTNEPIDDSGNYGFLDILQSLRWIKENIGNFGGNPNNVTLAGQSAGARNVNAALISPHAIGLFHKAVSLSGGMTTADPKLGEQKALEILIRLVLDEGIVATKDEARHWITSQPKEHVAEYLRNMKSEVFARFISDPAIRMEPFPHLFRDGAVIPYEGFGRIHSGNYNKVPMLLGSTETEFSGFAASDPYFSKSLMDSSIFQNKFLLKRYLAAIRFGSELYAGYNVERTAEKLASHGDQPEIYGYRFAWGTRDGVTSSEIKTILGATHGADLDFYTGYSTGPALYLGNAYYNESNKPGRAKLSSAMTEYLKRFLHSGNPNGGHLNEWIPWPKNGGSGAILRLDADKEDLVIEMTTGYSSKESILERMEKNLNKSDFDFLTNEMFSGRFFFE